MRHFWWQHYKLNRHTIQDNIAWCNAVAVTWRTNSNKNCKVFKHVCLIQFKHIIFLLLFFSPFPALNIGHCNPIPTGQPTTRNPTLKEKVEFSSLVLRGLLLFLMGMGSTKRSLILWWLPLPASMHLLRALFAKVPNSSNRVDIIMENSPQPLPLPEFRKEAFQIYLFRD